MKNLKMLIIMLGVVISLMCAAFMAGGQNANKVYEQNHLQSKINQELSMQELKEKNVQIDNFVKTIQKETKIVLLTQTGTTHTKLDKKDQKWNEFLTKAELEMEIEYKALIGINTNDIVFTKSDKGVTIQFNNKDITVLSLEITDETTSSKRAIFANPFSDDDKTTVRKYLSEQTKIQMMENKKIISDSEKQLKQYFKDLAKDMNVNVQIVDVK